jgi:hypothetical protein
MPVVVHHTVGHERDGMLLQALSQNGQKVAIILRPDEHRRAAAAAVDDVEIVRFVAGAGASWH